jgi:hypothetical protein
MVDVETDGPCPGLYSMISLGAVLVSPDVASGKVTSFKATFRPLAGAKWDPEALKVMGATYAQTLDYADPRASMNDFARFVRDFNKGEKPRFISDNNGFDWQFVNYYFHKFVGENPFGHSSTNLGSLYKGLVKDSTKNFKHLRQTKHTHDPVDDARGNAEALLHMISVMGLVFPL